MSNYTKTVDFAAKDTLPSGDSGKIIKGTEFETEFDNISTAIATKADSAAPTFTGTSVFTNLDINGTVQADGAVTVGVDDTGYDVKFFGATAGKSLLWDESADTLIVTGDSTVSGTLGVTGVLTATSLDISGDIDVDGTANLDVVDIDGAVDFGSTTAHAGNATFADNAKAIFGAGSDLQIYSDGTTGQVTGDVNVTGSVTADGLTVEGSSTGTLNVVNFLNTDTSANATANRLGLGISNSSGANYTYIEANEAGVDAFADMNFYTGVTATKRMTLGVQGDISFYNDAAAQGLFWDSSESRLGLGTTTPSDNIHVYASSGGATLKIESNLSNAYDSSKLELLGGNLSTSEIVMGDASVADVGKIIYRHDGNSLAFNVASTERMRIDASGNLLVGQTAFLGSSTGQAISFGSPTGNYISWEHGGSVVGDMGTANQAVASGSATDLGITARTGAIVFAAGGTAEKMRIDSSGNLLVGKTSNSVDVVGGIIRSDGLVNGCSDQSYSAIFSRNTTPGDIVLFRKDGATVGSIGTSTGGLYIADAGVGFRFDSGGTDDIIPCDATGGAADASINLGSSGARFKDLYLSGAAYVGTEVVLTDSGTAKFAIGNSGDDFYIYSNAAGSERMRIDASGHLLVGRSSAGAAATDDGHVFYGTGQHYIFSNATECVRFYETSGSGQQVGSISITSSATAFNTSSDQRLKENIVDADDAGSKIDAIQVRKFEWKVDGSHQDYGMVAQELLEVAPEAVSVPEDPEEMMGVDYSKLVPMMLKEIQSLRARIAALES